MTEHFMHGNNDGLPSDESETTGESPASTAEARRVRKNHKALKVVAGLAIGAAAASAGLYFGKVKPAEEKAQRQQDLASQEVAFDSTLRQNGFNSIVVDFTNFSHSKEADTALVKTVSEQHKDCNVVYQVSRSANRFHFALPPLTDAAGNTFPSFTGESAVEVTAETDHLCELKAQASTAASSPAPSETSIPTLSPGK